MSDFPSKPVRPTFKEMPEVSESGSTPKTENLSLIENYDPLEKEVEVYIEPVADQISNQHATDYLEHYVTSQELPAGSYPTLTTYPQYTPAYAPLAPIQAPVHIIPTTSAVALTKTKSNLVMLWSAFGLLATVGVLFAVQFFLTMNNLRNMDSIGFWLFLSPLAVVGVLFLVLGMKEKSYQPPNERILSYATLGLAFLVPLAPILSAALYGMGIGD